MPGCDWMWWGLLANQNHVWRYAEVCGRVHRGMQRCAEGWPEVCRGAWRYAEVCGGVCGGMQRYAEVFRGVHRSMQRCVTPIN